MKYEAKELKNTVDIVEVEVTVDYSELDRVQEEVYKELAKDVKIEGFRPGKAPRKKIEAKLGSKLLTESVGRILPIAAWEVIKDKDYKPTSSPEYSLKKVSDGDGIVFTFNFVNYPEIKLGDFSKIKVKKSEANVTKKDIDSVIRSIVRSSLKPEEIKKLADIKEVKKSKSDSNKKKSKENDENEIPEDFQLNDKIVEALKYEGEKTLKDLRASVENKLKEMKADQVEKEYNSKVLEEAIQLSKFEIPKSFIEREVKGAEAQFVERLKELKLEPDTYLKTQGSSLEKKRKEWEEDAKRKIGVDLVLIALANEHGVVAKDKDIDAEIEAIEDAAVKAQYDNTNAREYVRTVITRQRGMLRLLEIVDADKKK